MRLACLAVVSTLAGCANANPDDASLAVSPTSLTLAIGQSVMVAATSERADVMNLDWTVDDPTIATVVAGNAGAATVTGVAAGETRIVARLGNVERTIDVVVGSAAIESLEVTAMTPMVAAGLDTQLVATAHYTDGTSVDVSSMASWITGNDQVATVDAHGNVTAVAVGNADISATLMGEKGVLAISVTAAVLKSITVAKPALIAKGLTAQLVAMGTYTDGTMTDITSSVTWSTVDSTVATIAAGLVHAIGVGTTEIDCVEDDVSGSTSVDIGPAIVVSIAITPSPLSLPLGVAQPLVATGTFSDTTTADVTAMSTWTVATGSAVTVSPAGVVQAVAQGPATVTAAIGDATGSVDANVGPAVADHVDLSTGNLVLAQAQQTTIHASLVFTDATAQDVTATASWSSSVSGVASVVAGLVTGVASGGPATITATASGLSAHVTATVTTATCHPVINEVQAGATGDAADEWVELYNPCSTTIDVSTWTLVYRSATNVGGTDTNTLQALAGTMAPGSFRLYAGGDYPGAFDGTKWGGGTSGLLQKNNGGIGLRSGPVSTGPLVDSVAYGTVTAGHPFIEGGAASMLSDDKSIARLPFDGNDTNANNIDFDVVATPTPRASNAP